MAFQEGEIRDVKVRKIAKHFDKRGWLAELFREDELEKEYLPVMSYISVTEPGVQRGPHEHVRQTDLFAFIGPSTFKVFLWDARKNSPSHGRKMVVEAGEENPCSVLIPPGVVHAYKNIGPVPGMVVNLPNALYAGKGKKETVDELRHEDDPHTPYVMD